MADSIREQILANIGSRLTEILTANQYETDMGGEVLRSHLPMVGHSQVPCVGYQVEEEENTALYSRKEDWTMPVTVQGIAKFSDSIMPAKMSEKIYADIMECMGSDEVTVTFKTGASAIIAGMRIIGESSAAEGLAIAVNVTTGAWGSGNAAGTILCRRTKGMFTNNESIKVGLTTGMAVVNGTPTGQTAATIVSGGLADAITPFIGSVIAPEPESLTCGARCTFNIRYKRIAGNPYSQT